MPTSRIELEKREGAILAPFAQLSALTRGRRYDEPPPEWRTHFQRDRDRVIHSRAFRRLEYKTQVFLNGTGDHLRTRLTHTMEVAGISRNIARALALNEDLTETIALAHDLGHSPFGHKGETVLNRLMHEHGGFEHNVQSLRIVEELEQKYPEFAGLNLTWEVREGLAKHFTYPDARSVKPWRSPSLEAQAANLADEIAYYSHDLDDGLEAGLLDEDQLAAETRIWRETARTVAQQHPNLSEDTRRSFIIRCIIDDQVKDVVLTSHAQILAAEVHCADDARHLDKPLIRYSPERRETNQELRKFLYDHLYFNPQVREPNARALRMMEQLFHFYTAHPNEVGHQARRRAEKWGWPRTVCDYISGMTDRYVAREYQRIFGALPPASLQDSSSP